ncbi:helix-turn-helix transcriptional regulator [Actinomadura vinacea]|uniref:Helix-turn-helix transcriptional regulator n=1 Tax=Actinomadura vinacea TaxID=115336 RepID=A0ABN3JKM5_9ACTN
MARQKRANVSPMLLAFGKQLRRYREAKGLSQEAAGQRVPVTGQYVGLVEKGKSRCTREFAATMDRELGADGRLLDLWDDLVKSPAWPTWFDWHAVEGEAIMLVSYSLALVHGLLQIPEYAAAMLHGDQAAVEARLSRQGILVREDPLPPDCVFLIDSCALHREVGSPAIMRGQLEHLITMIEKGATIQVVPTEGTHMGNMGSFTLATLEDLQEVAYVETAAKGFTMGDPEDLVAFRKALQEIQACALPVRQSVDELARTVEQWK